LLEVGDEAGIVLFVFEELVELVPAAVGAAPSEPTGGPVAVGSPGGLVAVGSPGGAVAVGSPGGPVAVGAPGGVVALGEDSEAGAPRIPDADVLAGVEGSPTTPLLFVDPSPGATVEFEVVAFGSEGLTWRMKTRDALPTATK
jgi:hypothetical protein